MSFKPLFARSLSAARERLHFAAHSHHLWPDASFDGQVECWEDAARLADRKWDRIMGEVWPFAQAEVAAELGGGRAEDIVFSANTHDFIIRLVAACPRRGQAIRVLASDGEFHSARRQFARWAEDGWFQLETVAVEPFDTFADRFLARARSGDHDLLFVSQILFGSGRSFDPVDDLAALARPEGPWVVVDGYHSFMAIERPFSQIAAASAFFLGGGYKYAMSGEGMGFLHCPPGFGPRPPITGWYAEFEDLRLPPGTTGYAPDARRFMGATFDPSALYRFGHVRRMLAGEGLGTERISALAMALQDRLLAAIGRTPLARARLLNPPGEGPRARFLAFRHADAPRWQQDLADAGVVTDNRGEVLRLGFGLYQDEEDVDRLVEHLAALG